MTVRGRFTLLLVLLLTNSANIVLACPFCGAPQTTLSERLSKSHVVVLVKWLDTKNGQGNATGSTSFQVLEPAVNAAEGISFKKNETIKLPRPFFAKLGTTCLLLGTKSDEMRWDTPLEATAESYRYLKAAPQYGKPNAVRLSYFLPHLESPDSLIATDAFAEFALSPYEIVESMASQLPREKLRGWLNDSKTVPARLGLFGLMLGLCGDLADADLLRGKITEPIKESSLGRDGMIFGYLLLTGSKGLAWIDESKLGKREPTLDEDQVKLRQRLDDITAVVQALEVLWTTGRHGISRERLKLSLRRVLAWPEVGGRVVADLALWQDWSVQDQLMKLYESEHEDRRLQEAILGYFFAAASAKPSESALQAQANLDKLKQLNLKQYKDVERFFAPKSK